MSSFSYVLFFSPVIERYKLARIKSDFINPNNPEMLYIFDEDKLEFGKRVLNYMNETF